MLVGYEMFGVWPEGLSASNGDVVKLDRPAGISVDRDSFGINIVGVTGLIRRCGQQRKHNRHR